MDAVIGALEDAHRRLGIASLSIAVRVDGSERLHHTVGLARRDPPRAAHLDQAYDLASLTKPLAGSTVAASLIATGGLHLADPVRRWAPALPAGLTVGHLLEHTSGLPAWAPLHAEVADMWGTRAAREAIVSRACATAPVHPPGEVTCYSDLGFLVLLRILEAAADAPLEVALHERVIGPAGGADLRWGWPEAAATERCPVRQALVQGTVHDLNCAAMGGVSTHAGLFGTARGVAALAEGLMEAAVGSGEHPIGPTLGTFWARVSPSGRRVGWDGVTPGASSTGRHFPPDTIGHLGYTGTSLWVVPSRRTVVCLLTNRVHPVDDPAAIRLARPAIHDAVAAALGWRSAAG